MCLQNWCRETLDGALLSWHRQLKDGASVPAIFICIRCKVLITILDHSCVEIDDLPFST